MTGTTEDKPIPEFDWTPQMKGYLLSSFFYSYALMQLPAGVLVKHIPPHVLYTIAVFVSATITLFTPMLAKYFYVLLGARVVMGFVQAVTVPIAVTFLASWSPILERSRMKSIIASGAFIGTVLTMPISGAVGEYLGWQWIFYVFAITSYVWCLFWVICIRSTPENDRFITKEELQFIHRTKGDSASKTVPIPWKYVLTSIPVWSVAFGNFSWGWGYQTMLAQLPQFLKEVAGFDLAKNGLLSSLPYITMTIMTWMAGYIADFLLIKGFTITQVRKCFLCIALLIQSMFLIIAAYVIIPGINIFCLSMSVGFGAITYAAIGVNPLDLAPSFSSIIAGISNTWGSFPGIVSPILAGYIVTADKNDADTLKDQWQIIFFISAGIYIAGSIVYWIGGSAELQPWAKGAPEVSLDKLEKSIADKRISGNKTEI